MPQSVDSFQSHEACTARQSSAHTYPCNAPGVRVLQRQDSCQTIINLKQTCKKWYSHTMFAKTFVVKFVISTFLPRSSLGNVSVVNPPSCVRREPPQALGFLTSPSNLKFTGS